MSAHEQPPERAFASPARRRWGRLAMLSGAALLLHAAALGGFGWVWPEPPREPAVPLQLRVVEAPAAPVVAALPVEGVVPMPEAAPPAPAAPARARAVRPAALRPAVARRPDPVPQPEAAAPSPEAPQAFAAPLLLAAASAPEATSAPAEDAPVPSYRTRLPPSMALRYEVTHGALQGNGDLSWRVRGDQYELTLEARVAGIAALTQTSSGALDGAGLAPLRFLDKRLGRAPMAANFQRDASKISYSGTKKEFALRPGAQDRLSWMLQLAAIVAAEPKYAKAGATVSMFVTGARGDAGVWVFRCIGQEAIDGPGGSVDAIKFIREPRDPNDTHVQVWLDPKQHDLPLRANQKSGPNDDGYDLRLLEARPAN